MSNTEDRERVLIVDDEAGVRIFLQDLLSRSGYTTTAVHDGPSALNLLERTPFDLVLADISMTPMDGIELTRRIKETDPQVAVVLMTGYPSIENAVMGIKEGASDYLTKPFTPDTLRITLKKSLEHRRLRRENELLRSELAEKFGLDNIIGKSGVMRKLLAMVAKVAPTDSTVLVQGESGTGKELIARAIHTLSMRREKNFVTVNCGALVDTLLESELFGHVKGAFTGATSRKSGLFLFANTGSFFMDEIGDLSTALQPKLLRVLQEGEIKEVGGVDTLKVDVRVIAATNRDLKEDVATGRFREDLYYRLHVINLYVPPLRERREDIPLLVDRFIQRYTSRTASRVRGITPEALDMLMRYPWPGNVRELENAIERALILSSNDLLVPRDFADKVGGGLSPRRADGVYPFEGMSLEEVERRHIEHTLDKVSGNRTRAAQLLGINRTTLWKKLSQEETPPGEQPPDSPI
ncbi:MAG: sigma-54-dependent Fis family transcriptional regulator [Deltaproteobacteria bacterium]|nr:sigma-54-dependent Fis family transcriptional regulator [Deltaproteobacteria bacterium]